MENIHNRVVYLFILFYFIGNTSDSLKISTIEGFFGNLKFCPTTYSLFHWMRQAEAKSTRNISLIQSLNPGKTFSKTSVISIFSN